MKHALYITLDEEAKTVRFSGPGTFDAKEDIKSLGPAKWISDRKQWEVRSWTGNKEELIDLFSEFELLFQPTPAKSPAASAVVTASAEVTEAVTVEEPKKRGRKAKVEVAQVEVASEPTVTAGDSGVPTGCSVSELLESIHFALNRAFPKTVFVYGVVSKVVRSGTRIFLDLATKERPDETLSGVVWENSDQIDAALEKFGFKLERDLEVMFEAKVGFNRKRGQVSLTLQRIVPEYTVMKLAALREQTNQRLKQEGIFDRNRQLPIPMLPRRLGVLTSASGTVINDFLASLSEAKFGFELFVQHVSVQGIEAKEQILSGLRRFNEQETLDLILIFRGGGSAAELSIFNDYDIARAVALSSRPVFSAIGHQEDQTSTQDVSARMFGVPKDLGHFLAQIVIDLRRQLFENGNAIISSVSAIREMHEQLLSSISKALVATCRSSVELFQERLSGTCVNLLSRANGFEISCRSRLRTLVQHLPGIFGMTLTARSRVLRELGPRIAQLCEASLTLRQTQGGRVTSSILESGKRITDRAQGRLASHRMLPSVLTGILDKQEDRLAGYERLIQEVDPANQLRRGFAIVRKDGNGEIVLKRESVKRGAQVEIQFADGSVSAAIGENVKTGGTTDGK